MFAFLVRRILSGFLIVVLVSILVYTLFWYGPKSPALELCRRDTNNRCDARRGSSEYEERLGYNNPITEEYAKWVKGLFVGPRRSRSAPPTYTARRLAWACPTATAPR